MFVWLIMISDHGANPVLFNKKIKIGRPEYSANRSHPPTSDNILFLSQVLAPPLPPPSPSPLKVDVICVSHHIISFHFIWNHEQIQFKKLLHDFNKFHCNL